MAHCGNVPGGQSGSGAGQGTGKLCDVRTIVAREGTLTVTTSLQPPATERSRRRPTRRQMTEPSYGDSFEIIPPPANGVPRSAWFRARRMSTWHRPYAATLLALDFVAGALANLTIGAAYAKAPAGFDRQRGPLDLI